uniref:Uncharacterized protein n=1 Tax=viral metagenome TaxID=1070528 RepID=A0A6M3KYP7_9ZZZZ
MKLFFVGIGVGFILLAFFSTTNVKASTRSSYMDMGDKYLNEKPISYQGVQAYALKALACYTAALAEK